MTRKLLFWLSGYLPCRLIYEDGEGGGRPYLQRYYVCSLFGLRFLLHRFVGSDPDRGLHSHPWPWAMSFILSGYYYEDRFTGEQGVHDIRKVSWINFLMGESHHRVILPADYFDMMTNGDRAYADDYADAPRECWSLFIHRDGRKRRWGFLRPVEAPDPHAPLRRTTPGFGRMQAPEPDQFLFTPFRYPDGASSFGRWWTTAPRGRHIEGR